MKVLVLNGSPKKKSDTFRLTEAFLNGMNKEQENTVITINVFENDIAPCRGCFDCWSNMDGHCVIQDDQNEILDLYTKADVVIWSFPLYCYSMPSHLKAVLDRTIPLVKMRMVEESDGTIRHEALADFSRIHTLVICGCGFPDWEGNFDALKIMCKNCFCDPTVKQILVYAGSVFAGLICHIQISETFKDNEIIKKRACKILAGLFIFT